MSYGRSPYYIYSDGTTLSFHGDGVDAHIPEDAINQFIATLANRGDGEINGRIEAGKKLRPMISPNLRVVVIGDGWV